jgi:hypothetical protein
MLEAVETIDKKIIGKLTSFSKEIKRSEMIAARAMEELQSR